MPISVTPNQSDIDKALRAFLLNIMAPPVNVVKGQVNRVPQVVGPDFIVTWPIRRERLETNYDAVFGAGFIGSITGSTLSVTELDYGTLILGGLINGMGVDPGLTIIGLSTGMGGVGNYSLSSAQSVAVPPSSLFAGAKTVQQQTRVVMQLDVHGPNGGDNAQIISTLFRDQFGVAAFAALNPAISPLYADDPRQLPFVNAEQQYEDRWVVEAHLQVAELVYGLPQQFATSLDLVLVEIEAQFPALPGAGPSLDFTIPDNSMYIPIVP